MQFGQLRLAQGAALSCMAGSLCDPCSTYVRSLRCVPALRAWAERLQQHGKPKKIVLVAVMRTLLHIAYGVWKNDEDYEPTVAFALAV